MKTITLSILTTTLSTRLTKLIEPVILRTFIVAHLSTAKPRASITSVDITLIYEPESTIARSIVSYSIILYLIISNEYNTKTSYLYRVILDRPYRK